MSDTTLNFEYCECGCHGFEATKKGLSYWIYMQLSVSSKSGKELFHLYRGHGWLGEKLSVHETYEMAKAAAANHFDQQP